jgi:hypothetical protein
LSTTLFKIFLEEILKGWTKKCQQMDIKIDEEYLHTFSFADDQVIIDGDEYEVSK